MLSNNPTVVLDKIFKSCKNVSRSNFREYILIRVVICLIIMVFYFSFTKLFLVMSKILKVYD